MQVINAEYRKYEQAGGSGNEVQLIRSRFAIAGRGADMMMYYKKLFSLRARSMIARKIEGFENELNGRVGPLLREPTSPWIPVLSMEEVAERIMRGNKCVNLFGATCEYILVDLQNAIMTDREPVLWNVKVKVADERLATSVLAEKYYTGLALLSLHSDPGSIRADLSVERLYGDFSGNKQDVRILFEELGVLEAELAGITLPDIKDFQEDYLAVNNNSAYGYDEGDSLALENDPNWWAYLDEENFIDEMERALDRVDNEQDAEDRWKIEVEERVDLLESEMGLYDEYESEDPSENDFATNYTITYLVELDDDDDDLPI